MKHLRQWTLVVRAQLLRGFYLGDTLVEPLKGLVTSDGQPKAIPPEAVDVLLHLASQPGEILSRSFLIDEVWGRERGSHEALGHAIDTLRDCLGDDHHAPRFIETIKDRGHRLLTDVRLSHFEENHVESRDLKQIQRSADGQPTVLAQLWDELQKRRVVRVGIGYLISAWAIMQIGDLLADVFELPAWSMKLVTILLAAGFMVTVVTSWLLQVTPDGIILDRRSDKETRREWLHLAEFALIVVLLVAVGYVGYHLIWQQSHPEPNTPASTASNEQTSGLSMPNYEASIAVLPFVNLSDDPADRYFGDGLAEELLHKLVKVRSLKVAARTSSFAYGGSQADIPTIASTLHVENVLEGSIRREGQRMRVTAQLIDAEGFHLWSEAFDVTQGGVLDMQSKIALEVAKQITTDLSPEVHASLTEWSTDSIEAYEMYLQGLDYLRQPRQEDSLIQAAALFSEAIDRDPRFARAYAGACETELAFYRLSRDLANFENAERWCNRALTLDADLPEVHTALGNLYRTSSQYEAAQLSFEKALDLNPYYEEANYGLARSLQGQGNLKEAEQLLRFSIELEPGYWAPYLSLGNFLHRLGRLEESIPYYLKVTELTPDNPDGFTNLGTAYYDLNDWDKAAEAWSRSVELKPTPMGYRNMGTLHYYRAEYDQAVAMHKKAVELSPRDHWAWGRLAAALRYIEGKEPDSQEAYERAIELAYERLRVEPSDARTMAPLAAYLVNIGDNENAEEYANQAVGIEPENPTIWYFSAIVNIRSGNQQQAIADLDRAIQLGYSTRLLRVDPQFSSLRDTEIFTTLIQ